ncbi:contractile injection system protein, VgrG/Pvc8 family, partial [Pseudoduganella buxea]
MMAGVMGAQCRSSEMRSLERFAGRVGVNELYDVDVQALSTSTGLDLDQFIGEEMTVTLLQPDGSRRAWHGLCT